MAPQHQSQHRLRHRRFLAWKLSHPLCRELRIRLQYSKRLRSASESGRRKSGGSRKRLRHLLLDLPHQSIRTVGASFLSRMVHPRLWLGRTPSIMGVVLHRQQHCV